jgi:hypothetical protein
VLLELGGPSLSPAREDGASLELRHGHDGHGKDVRIETRTQARDPLIFSEDGRNDRGIAEQGG